jgi:hypothetical protein
VIVCGQKKFEQSFFSNKICRPTVDEEVFSIQIFPLLKFFVDRNGIIKNAQ